MGEQQAGGDARSRAERAVARADRALRDGRAELAESRERADRLGRDPVQHGATQDGTATPTQLRAEAVAFRERLGLAPVVAPAPEPVRPARAQADDDEPFGDTGFLQRA